MLLEYGLVKDYADSTLYGIQRKRKLKPDNNELLNPEQAAVYRYVFSYIIHHRYAPTYDEILKNCKVRSKSTVSLYIRKMLKLGLLESDAPGSQEHCVCQIQFEFHSQAVFDSLYFLSANVFLV